MDWAIEERGYSQRRACGRVGIAPRVYRCRSPRPDDAGLRQRLRELAAQRRRFGYRRLHLLLRQEGVAVNWKKLYRLYKEERLTVKKRGGRKRASEIYLERALHRTYWPRHLEQASHSAVIDRKHTTRRRA